MDVIIFHTEMKRNGLTIHYSIVKSYDGITPSDIDIDYYCSMSYIEKEHYLISIGGEPVKPAYGYRNVIVKCPVNKVYIENPNGWTDTVFGHSIEIGGYLIYHEYRYRKYIEAIPVIYC